MGSASAPVTWPTDGAVLITGGTGGLGALVAEHLVAAHGVRDLVLVGRRGDRADGAERTVAALRTLGAQVEVVACDIADRDQAAALIAGVGDRLRAVVHAAGVVDDGIFESLDVDRLRRVLRPKVDGAWHLHELTADLDLAAFVLFSSAAGVLGSPGQANYAAANAFLDALAERRRGRGQPAVSIAWGLWARTSAMTEALGRLDRARLAGVGIVPLDDRTGLALLDAAVGGDAVTVAVAVDPAAGDGMRTLVPGLAEPASAAPDDAALLVERLGGLPEFERVAQLVRLICGEVAAVLRHASADAIDPDRAFVDMGFDSLGAVDLRNRLSRTTGRTVPTTVVFDHPTARAVAGYVDRLLFPPLPDPVVESAVVDLDSVDDDTLVRLALAGEHTDQGSPA